MNGAATNATTPMAMIAARHDGSARAAASPDQTDFSTLPLPPGGLDSRTNMTATTTARNDAAFATNVAG